MPQQKNGFFYFMIELRDKNPTKYKNLKDVSDDAGELWKKMDGPQRQPYNQRAKQDKGKSFKKYTNLGQDIEVVKRRENEKVNKVVSMESMIQQIITSAKEAGTLEDETFYIAHVNYFCHYETDNCYYPAEIAVGRFSLCNGVTPENMFYMFVKPGSLPLGYFFTASDYSQQTHQIEPPAGQHAENNLTEVLESLMKFMNESQNEDQNYPPIYTCKEDMKIVDNVLLNLCYNYGIEENLFQVFSLDYMFYTLRNAIASMEVWSRSYATVKINEEMYIFAPKIACPYHERSDVPNRCSRSIVFCYIYVICDNCCKDLNIDLIPGKHVPINAKIENASQSTDLPSMSSEKSKRYNIQDNLSYASSETSDFVSIPDLGIYQTIDQYNEESEAGASAWVDVKQKNKRDKNTIDSNLDSAMGNMSINNQNMGKCGTSKNTSRGRGSRLCQALLKNP